MREPSPLVLQQARSRSSSLTFPSVLYGSRRCLMSFRHGLDFSYDQSFSRDKIIDVLFRTLFLSSMRRITSPRLHSSKKGIILVRIDGGPCHSDNNFTFFGDSTRVRSAAFFPPVVLSMVPPKSSCKSLEKDAFAAPLPPLIVAYGREARK